MGLPNVLAALVQRADAVWGEGWANFVVLIDGGSEEREQLISLAPDGVPIFANLGLSLGKTGISSMPLGHYIYNPF